METTEKNKVCILATLSAKCILLVFILTIVFTFLSEQFGLSEKISLFIFGSIVFVLFAISFILAIISIIRIALSDGRLEGMTRARLVLVGTSVILLFAGSAEFSIHAGLVENIVCRTNLKSLGQALTYYAERHDGQLPNGDDWCDALINTSDITKNTFRCRASDALEGQSSYALNINAVGRTLAQLPPDMVLLFEVHDNTAPAIHWNQVGGPELMGMHHKKQTMVLFVNGDVDDIYCLPSESDILLEALRWDVENKPVKYSDYAMIIERLSIKPPFPMWSMLLGIGVGVAGAAGVIAGRVWRYPFFAATMSFGGLIVGALFGAWAEIYYQPEIYKGIGLFGGAAIGILAGLCYAGLMMRLQNLLTRDKSIKQLAVAVGVAIGGLAAALLHLSMALIHGHYMFILLGIPFGMLGGDILGMVSGQIVSKHYRKGANDGNH